MINWTKVIDELGHEQIYKDVDGAIWCVPNDESNSDYQEYLKWAEENNG